MELNLYTLSLNKKPDQSQTHKRILNKLIEEIVLL